VGLQQLQAGIQARIFAGMVGRTVEVLIDNVSRRRDWEVSGRTSGNTVVNLPGSPDEIGRLADVRVTGHGPNSLRGEAAAAGEARHAD
jgi:tRNA-2-methylthio-N6-dimethylallyladenosine synthase